MKYNLYDFIPFQSYLHNIECLLEMIISLEFLIILYDVYPFIIRKLYSLLSLMHYVNNSNKLSYNKNEKQQSLIEIYYKIFLEILISNNNKTKATEPISKCKYENSKVIMDMETKNTLERKDENKIIELACYEVIQEIISKINFIDHQNEIKSNNYEKKKNNKKNETNQVISKDHSICISLNMNKDQENTAKTSENNKIDSMDDRLLIESDKDVEKNSKIYKENQIKSMDHLELVGSNLNKDQIQNKNCEKNIAGSINHPAVVKSNIGNGQVNNKTTHKGDEIPNIVVHPELNKDKRNNGKYKNININTADDPLFANPTNYDGQVIKINCETNQIIPLSHQLLAHIKTPENKPKIKNYGINKMDFMKHEIVKISDINNDEKSNKDCENNNIPKKLLNINAKNLNDKNNIVLPDTKNNENYKNKMMATKFEETKPFQQEESDREKEIEVYLHFIQFRAKRNNHLTDIQRNIIVRWAKEMTLKNYYFDHDSLVIFFEINDFKYINEIMNDFNEKMFKSSTRHSVKSISCWLLKKSIAAKENIRKAFRPSKIICDIKIYKSYIDQASSKNKFLTNEQKNIVQEWLIQLCKEKDYFFDINALTIFFEIPVYSYYESIIQEFNMSCSIYINKNTKKTISGWLVQESLIAKKEIRCNKKHVRYNDKMIHKNSNYFDHYNKDYTVRHVTRILK